MDALGTEGFAGPCTEYRDMSMWEPFTERARRSIVLTQEEAQRLGNNYIGTENILLGILNEGESDAAKVLAKHGVTLESARAKFERHAGEPGGREIVFTPRAKRGVELAYEAGARLGLRYIGTEHLLLGLIAEGEGFGFRAI